MAQQRPLQHHHHCSSANSLWQCLKRGPLKVFVVGGGNWGTVISRIAAINAAKSYVFDTTVHMWLRDENWGGTPLTQVVNTTKENPKYLPGFKLPPHLVAVPTPFPYIEEADLIVVVKPHQYVDEVCHQLQGHIKPSARAISLVKGLKVTEGWPELYSSVISDTLGVPCSVLSGANVAIDIAREYFSESTLGYDPEDKEAAAVWQQLFDTPYFKVTGVPDVCGVEVCGALKNVVALAAGFCDALNYGTNTKAALMRIGVEEMKLFANFFFCGILEETFFDSAGVADVITTCFGGRNVKCAAEFARRGGKDSWDKVEADLLHGQKMQGQLTAKEIYEAIQRYALEEMLPLFTTTYRIAFEGAPPSDIINCFAVEEPRTLKNLSDCSACLVPESLRRHRDNVHHLRPPPQHMAIQGDMLVL